MGMRKGEKRGVMGLRVGVGVGLRRWGAAGALGVGWRGAVFMPPGRWLG